MIQLDIRLSFFLTLVVLSFFLHLGWESLHVGLYTGYEQLGSSLPIIVMRATLGDVAYTLFVMIFFTALKDDLAWVLKMKWQDYAALAVAGLLVALFVEYKAMFFDLWEYRETMPMVPVLGVGLTPLVQMAALLPATVFLAKFISDVERE